VYSVSQSPKPGHLYELLGRTGGLLERVNFKKRTECMWWWTSANARWEWVPDSGGQQCWNCRRQRLCGPRNQQL